MGNQKGGLPEAEGRVPAREEVEIWSNMIHQSPEEEGR